MACAVLLASWPHLGGLRTGHDAYFHIIRFENLASALAEGQFPARVGGFSYNGFGAATSVFYPDIFLVPFALLRLLGLPTASALCLLFMFVNAGACLCMYTCARRFLKDRDMAALAAVFYTLAQYRLTNQYPRFALGEALAGVFLPWFFYALWRLVYEDGKALPLAVAASCVFLCHLISTLICAILAVMVCLPALRRLPHFAGRLVAAVLLAGLLCAFQLVPLADYSAQGLGAASLARGMGEYILTPAELFLTDQYDALGVFFPMLALLGGAAWLRGREHNPYLVSLIMLSLLLCALCVTRLPWSFAERVTRGFMNYIQFPWRLIGFAVLFLAVAGSYGCVKLWGRRALALGFCLAVIAAIPVVRLGSMSDVVLRNDEAVNPFLANEEYMLPDATVSVTRRPIPQTTGGVQLRGYEKQGTHVEAELTAEEAGTLALPLFAYDGYKATLNGAVADIYCGEGGRLTLDVPAGTEGTLSVWFAGKPLWRVADAVSLAAWLAAGAAALLRRQKKGGTEGEAAAD